MFNQLLWIKNKILNPLQYSFRKNSLTYMHDTDGFVKIDCRYYIWSSAHTGD